MLESTGVEVARLELGTVGDCVDEATGISGAVGSTEDEVEVDGTVLDNEVGSAEDEDDVAVPDGEVGSAEDELVSDGSALGTGELVG